jgi:hypothetical protein
MAPASPFPLNGLAELMRGARAPAYGPFLARSLRCLQRKKPLLHKATWLAGARHHSTSPNSYRLLGAIGV